MPEQGVPVMYEAETRIVPASFYGTNGVVLDALDTEQLNLLNLVSYDSAYAFMEQHRPPHGPRRVTNTWIWLSRAAMGKSAKYGNNPSALNPENVKKHLFTPDFIIASATRASDWMRKSSGNSFTGYSRISAPFIIDLANDMLHAEPPVAQIY